MRGLDVAQWPPRKRQEHLGVMMLAAAKGSKVAIETSGADEEEAMQAVVQLIADKFGESE